MVASATLFTSRRHGVSQAPYEERNLALHVGDQEERVLRNRADLAAELSLTTHQLFFMNQTHGTVIAEINRPRSAGERDVPPDCDAMITRTPGIALAVLVADCAPVLLHGKEASAVIHVGWRGLFGGILEKVVAQLGASSFTAAIGPTICGKCYTVGDDLFEVAREKGMDRYVCTERTLDIPQSIIKVLHQCAGNRLIDVQWNNVCTYEETEYFSFRRDKITGRQAGVVIHGS